MRNKVAKEIRRFLKEDQGLDLSHKANEERGIRGEKIGEMTVLRLIDGIDSEELIEMMQFRNPEKNFYRNIKRKYVKGGI